MDIDKVIADLKVEKGKDSFNSALIDTTIGLAEQVKKLDGMRKRRLAELKKKILDPTLSMDESFSIAEEIKELET